MTRILCAVLSPVLLAGIALSQDATPPASGATPGSPQTQPAASPANTPRIAPGSVIPAELTKGVDAKKAKTGDEVVAKVTQDMKTSSGEVLVAKDTKIVGHVTEAQARSKEQKESQLGIAFDRAITKDGKEMQLPMSIQAIVGSQNDNESAAETSGPSYSAPSGGGGGTMGGGGMSGGGAGRPQSKPPSSTGGNMPNDTSKETNGRPQINGQTQGVIGISNLKLAPASSGTPGSVVTSEKNNVKLETGTLLLLRVTP